MPLRRLGRSGPRAALMALLGAGCTTGLATAMLPGSAQAAWHQAQSAHFTLYADLPAARVRDLADRLERFDALLRTTVATKEGARRRVTVFIPSVRAEFQRLVRDRAIGGYYSGTWRGCYIYAPAYMLSALGDGRQDDMIVLFHEYAHHFMLEWFPSVYPAWFSEGFAEFYSTVRFTPDGNVEIGRPPQFRGYGLAGGQTPLVQLLAARTAQDDQSPALRDRFYGTAWLLTHYLYFTPGQTDRLDAYLRAYSTGVAPMEAARSFGDVAELQSDLNRYVRKRRIAFARKALTVSPSVTVTPLTPAQAAMIPAWMAVTAGYGANDPARLAEAALAATTRWPDAPSGWAVLAETSLSLGDMDKAAAANDRLLALRPDDSEGLILRARIARARLLIIPVASVTSGSIGDLVNHRPSGTHTPGPGDRGAGWDEVRRLAARANHADPNAPWPLAIYFTSFLSQGVAPPPRASAGLAGAFRIAPQVDSLRLLYAADLVRLGKKDQARAILMPLLNAPHSASTNPADLVNALLAAPPGSLDVFSLLNRRGPSAPTG